MKRTNRATAIAATLELDKMIYILIRSILIKYLNVFSTLSLRFPGSNFSLTRMSDPLIMYEIWTNCSILHLPSKSSSVKTQPKLASLTVHSLTRDR